MKGAHVNLPLPILKKKTILDEVADGWIKKILINSQLGLQNALQKGYSHKCKVLFLRLKNHSSRQVSIHVFFMRFYVFIKFLQG